MAGRQINDFAGINPISDTAVFYDRKDGRVCSARRYLECQDGVFSIFAGDTRLDFELQKYQDVRLQQLVYVDN